MKIIYIDRGKQAKIDYRQEWLSDIDNQELQGFGQETVSKYLEQARTLILQTHPDAEIILEMPVLLANLSIRENENEIKS